MRLVRGLRRTIWTARLLRRFKPSLIVASSERSVWMASLLAWDRRSTPWIAVVHGAEVGVNEPWRRRVSRWAYRRADAVVCVSQYTKARTLELGISPNRIRVIENGADETLLHPIEDARTREFRASLGLSEALILLTVGSVTERKGQEVVVRALPEVLKSIPNVHYVMVGLPVIADRLNALGRDVGVADRLHFLGRLDNASLLLAYNASDLFVMTSQHSSDGDFEGYGIAVVEAALCGKPAVVSSGSGVQESIEPDVTGLVADHSDPSSTARAIVALLSDPARLARMGQESRRTALAEATWTHRMGAYRRLCEDIAFEHLGAGE